jgi:hypothetical protein
MLDPGQRHRVQYAGSALERSLIWVIFLSAFSGLQFTRRCVCRKSGGAAMKNTEVIDLGAPDPELKNSPIIDSEIEEGEFFGVDQEVQVCYFNGIRYPEGDYICSGNEFYRCENGVWVRSGSRYD